MKSFITAVVYPGSGYRLLNIGEVIRPDDEESHLMLNGMRSWLRVEDDRIARKIHKPRRGVAFPYGYYRRKIGD